MLLFDTRSQVLRNATIGHYVSNCEECYYWTLGHKFLGILLLDTRSQIVRNAAIGNYVTNRKECC